VKKETRIMQNYAKFQDQKEKGYIEKFDLTPEDINQMDIYFLRYFPVVNVTKDTSSLRIVFDATAKDRG